ncbi:MAG: hypothetical protein CW338_09340 [Clostridiales bacterium]|nr:hypothetical protein [Clostridiales bacterium]
MAERGAHGRIFRKLGLRSLFPPVRAYIRKAFRNAAAEGFFITVFFIPYFCPRAVRPVRAGLFFISAHAAFPPLSGNRSGAAAFSPAAFSCPFLPL